MIKLTPTLAALAFAALGGCASTQPARPLEIPSEAPTAPVKAVTPAPTPQAAPRPTTPAQAAAPKTEADRCVAKCLAERKAAGDEQASEFWCVQDCNGDNDW